MHRDRPEATDDVRESLRGLALGTAREEAVALDDVRRLVVDAEDSLAGVESACAFADDGGFKRLRAVDATTLTPSLATRTRRVLATLDRYRGAYREATGAADHFHSGHDTSMTRGEQRPDN